MKTLRIIIQCLLFVWLAVIIWSLLLISDVFFGPPQQPKITGWNGNDLLYIGEDGVTYEKAPDGHFTRISR